MTFPGGKMLRDTGLEVPIGLLAGERSFRSAAAYREGIAFMFSEEGLNAFLGMARNKGQVTEGINTDAINYHFLGQLGRLHGFPPNASKTRLRAHWGNALNEAYNLVDYARELVIPPGFGFEGQDTEGYDRSTEPWKILKALAYHPRSGYSLETRRQFGLALIIGDFMAFADTARLRDRNEEIGDLLDEKVFVSYGIQHDFVRYGHFDSSTNEFIGVSESPTPPDRHTDVKKISRRARFIEGVGSVHYKPRIKSPKRAALKALLESIGDGGKLSTIKHVPDKFGSKLVLLEGGEDEVGYVMEQVTAVMKGAFPGVRTESKDRVGSNRGQSKLMESLVPMRRALFYFPDLPENTGYELITQTLASEMNSEYMNGVVNRQTGRRTGPGHRHYELENLAGSAFDILFPTAIQRIDKKRALAVQSAIIAEELRYSQKPDPTIHFGELQNNGYFSPGHFLITEGSDGVQGATYEIIEDAPSQFRLRRPDGTEFWASQLRAKEHGLIGSESILGSVNRLF